MMCIYGPLPDEMLMILHTECAWICTQIRQAEIPSRTFITIPLRHVTQEAQSVQSFSHKGGQIIFLTRENYFPDQGTKFS